MLLIFYRSYNFINFENNLLLEQFLYIEKRFSIIYNFMNFYCNFT